MEADIPMEGKASRKVILQPQMKITNRDLGLYMDILLDAKGVPMFLGYLNDYFVTTATNAGSTCI